MKSPWRATHCIVFTPAAGTSKTWMVMVRSTMGGRCAEGITHGEWMSRTPPSWSYTPDTGWTWRGRETPYGATGTISIEELSGAYAVVPGPVPELRRI